MRFLPLLSSTEDPAPWTSFPAAELVWGGELHPGWLRGPIAVHALHLEARPWDEALLTMALEAVRPRLGADFLVLPADAPVDRTASFRFLGLLEALLEALSGRGLKLALRPAPGSVPALVTLLKEVRCDAVGYCWDEDVGEDLELIADRLFCAVGAPGGRYPSLQRLGYRWNMAIPLAEPAAAPALPALELAHPMIYFPEVTP